MSIPLRTVATLAMTSFALAACGGNFDAGSGNTGLDDGGAGRGGASSSSGGGTAVGGGAAGGSIGMGGSIGTGGWVGAGGLTACCLAMATCAPGDTEISGPESCPPGATCYENAICCSSVWCAKQPAPADAAVCDPVTEYGRNYVATSPGQCAVILFACPANTTYFVNACGCGCEQSPTCPEWASCMPGPGTVDPLCTTSGQALCPYTKIAY